MPFSLQPKALTCAKAGDQKAYWHPSKLQSHPLYSGNYKIIQYHNIFSAYVMFSGLPTM